MVNIGNLLDACRISYTDNQLTKLNKLVNELLKNLRFQKFGSYDTTQHNPIPVSEDKLRNEDFINKKELKPTHHFVQEFDIKPEPHFNNSVKEEIVEETEIKITEEFPHDPLASLETFNNSEDVSDMVHESYNLNKINDGNSDSILECSICLVAFFFSWRVCWTCMCSNKREKIWDWNWKPT